MRFGVYVHTFGDFDVAGIAAPAREAETAGWDGLFVWDHVLWDPTESGISDTTVVLSAVAMATERLRFGALVNAVARRRPWKLARETSTLDVASGGRLVVGAGLGGAVDFVPVGEEPDTRERAALLDESLEAGTA